MVVQELDKAQIDLVLVSDSVTQSRSLLRDVRSSKFIYTFARLASRATLLSDVRRQLALNGGRVPTVLVISYRFAGKDCEKVLRMLKNAALSAAIEYVVTEPPADEIVRQRLSLLGATLFDGDPDGASATLTLH